MKMDSTNDAIKFKDFYINLIENNQQNLRFHLSTNIVLDWFGKTIKTRKMVTSYFREKIGKITHDLNNVKFVEKIAFRDSHDIKIPKEESVTILSSPTLLNHCNDNNVTTPPLLEPSTSNSIEIGQSDSEQNALITPCKKIKLLSDIGGDDDNNSNDEDIEKNLKYITAYGSIEFHRPSVKKFQTETKWERPIKLHIGYTSNNFKDSTIYLIIYEGNLKCRRNLYKDFCDSDPQQKQRNDHD